MNDVFSFVVAASVALLLVPALRPMLRRWGGAAAQCQAWLLVPALPLARMLPAPTLPDLMPTQALPLQWVGAPVLATLAPLGTHQPAPWIGLWLGGALVVLLVAGLLHWRFLSRLQRHGRHWRLAPGSSAAWVGLLPPRLALPADFRQRFTRQERRLVFDHERVHAQRGDNVWSLLALLFTALLWFNPLAWWSLWRFRADQELACDAAVLRRQPGALRAYTRALLKAQTAQPFGAFASVHTTHPLVERITMLPTHSLQRPRPWLIALVVAAAGGLACAAQPVVSAATDMPLQEGYSKLRLDVQFAVNGKPMDPSILLLDLGHNRRMRFTPQPGSSYEMEVRGMPATAGTMELTVKLQDMQTGKTLGPLSLIVPEGMPASLAQVPEGTEPLLQLSVLPRLIRTRLSDTIGARAELLREIEAGAAPELHYRR
jgi:beta-lactamase regulating signal transducer with metallopeptidase domain